MIKSGGEFKSLSTLEDAGVLSFSSMPCLFLFQRKHKVQPELEKVTEVHQKQCNVGEPGALEVLAQ